MNKPTLTLAYTAAGAIGSRHIVTFKATKDDSVLQADASSDALLGVTSDLSVIEDEPVDVVVSGCAAVVYGATVAAGNLLTADSKGRAIPASDSNRIIGIALQNGVVKDLGSVLLKQS